MAEDLLEILKNFLVAPHWYPVVPVIGFIVIAAASSWSRSRRGLCISWLWRKKSGRDWSGKYHDI